MRDAGPARGRHPHEESHPNGDSRTSPRAGIVITGTEVLTGRVRDRNGPWLSERLAELGVDLAHTLIVGDRPADIESALRFMAGERLDLVITSGGLGPTADDLTAEIVGRVQGREMALDEALEHRIADILRPLAERYPKLDRGAIAAGNRKQATIPRGARALEPVGTAPGLVATPTQGRAGPTIVALPGPPRELQPMWAQALQTDELRAAISAATVYRQEVLRLFGIPESEIAETLRAAERRGVQLDRIEITTCLRGGEIEIVSRFQPQAQDVYDAFAHIVEERHSDTLFSHDGSTVDEQVARLLRGERIDDRTFGEQADQGHGECGEPIDRPVSTGASEDAQRSSAGVRRTIAVAESCTGGMLAARLTNPPGSSEYVLGGIVAYSNEVKIRDVGVDAELIAQHGAVSEQVAYALATGVREQLGADVGVGITGIAGPGGGSQEKPVGLVWLSVRGPDGASLTRSVHLPGGRADVRERAVTVAIHLIRRLLAGEADGERSLQPAP
jgi:nicotinamide-nucleotide amidase